MGSRGEKTVLSIAVLWTCYMAAQVVHLDHGSFSTEYDPALRIPVTADWLLFNTMLGKVKRESGWPFKEDSRVPSPRAKSSDYTRSGFDRGHMVPAADRSTSTQAMRSTFVMTNVCPQVPTLNRGSWKFYEDATRRVAAGGRKLRVRADAVFWRADTLRIGTDSVAVPHAFVKTVWDAEADTIMFSKYFQNW